MNTRVIYDAHYASICLCRLWIETLKDRCRCPTEFVEILVLECEELKRNIADTGLSN